MIIYKTTNLVNDKIYIGLDSKNREDYIGSGTLLNNAIKKYGRDNFKKEILCYCKSKEELCNKEKHYIKLYKSNDKSIGYNITPGGEFGDTLTNNPNRDIIIEKFRKAKLGKSHPHTKNWDNKISKAKFKYYETHDCYLKNKNVSKNVKKQIAKSVKKDWHKYHTKESLAKTGLKLRKGFIKKCLFCNSDFYTKKSHNGKYCSLKHYNLHKIKLNKEIVK